MSSGLFDAPLSPPPAPSPTTDESGPKSRSSPSRKRRPPAAKDGTEECCDRPRRGRSTVQSQARRRLRSGASPPVDPPRRNPQLAQAIRKDGRSAFATEVGEDEMMSESDVPLAIWQRSGQGAPEESFAVRLSQRFSERQHVRPGEQEALRSPFILGMLGLTLALALAAGRDLPGDRSRVDPAGIRRRDSRSSTRSVMVSRPICLTSSSSDYPRDSHADEAQYRMWNARVLKEIAGGSPAWKRGLEAVDKYVEANRDRRDFHEHYADLAGFPDADRIGSGPLGGERRRTVNLLDTSSAAQAMAARYYPDGKMPAELAARIQAALHEGARTRSSSTRGFPPRSPRSKRPTPIASRWRRWPPGGACWPSIPKSPATPGWRRFWKRP